MVALWFPKEELKADLEDQARKRLEEIQREAEKRRNAIVEGAQSKLNDQAIQDTVARFNNLVDPLFDKGRQALDGASQATEDVSERARQMVEEAQASINNAPKLDAFQNLPSQTPTLDGQTPPSPTPGLLGQPSTPPPTVPEVPEAPPPPPTPPMDGMAGADGLGSMSQNMFSAPGLGGLGGLSPRPAPPPPPMPGMDGMTPPPEPQGFKPPGLDGLGTALADRMRGGLDGIGDKVTEGRDQAMALAQQSLDVAQQALAKGGENFRQTPIAQATGDAADWLGTQARRAEQNTLPARAAIEEAHRIGTEAREADLASGRSNVVAGQSTDLARTLMGLRRTQNWDETQDATNQRREDLRIAAANGDMDEFRRLQAEERAATEAEGGIPQAAARRLGQFAGLGYLGATGLDPNAPGSDFAFKEERPVYDENGRFTGETQLVEAPTGAARVWRDAPEQLGTVLGREKTEALNRFLPPGQAKIPQSRRNENLLERGQAAFGLATQPFNMTGEVLHGAAGEATDDEAVAAGARLAGDVLGPGGAVAGYGRAAGVLGDVGTTALRSARLADNTRDVGRFAWEGAKEAAGNQGWVNMIHAGSIAAGLAAAPVAARVAYDSARAAGMNETEALAQAIDIGSASMQMGDLSDTVMGMGRPALRTAQATGRFLDRATEGLPDLAAGINQGVRGTPAFLGRLGSELQGSESGVLWGNPPMQLPARGPNAGRAEGAISTIQAPKGSEGSQTIRRESEIDWAGRTPREGETIDPETGTLSPSIEQIYLAAHAKGDLTDADLIRLGIGVPGDEGRLLGQGEKGEGLPAGLQGIPRTASFRHVGWKAKDVDVQITGPNEGTVTYKVPLVDDAALAAGGLKKKLRFGSAKKGDLRYEDMPTRADRAAEAAEDLEDMEEGATVPGGGVKVIVDADNNEVKELTDPRIQWQEKTTPITNTEGLTRDGKWKDGFNEKITPIEYQRAVLARGMGMRNFYPEFGRFFRDEIAQGSRELLKEASAIFGATASQASPEVNLQRTLAVMAAARDFAMRTDPRTKKPVGRLPNLDELRILVAREWDNKRMREMPLVGRKDVGAFPAGGITDADLKKVIQIWKNGRADIGAGWKTPVFAQNVVSAAESLFIPRSVPDTHAFRGQGYTQTGGGPSSSVNSALQALGVTDANVHQLAKEFGLSYDQVQSALWYRYKEELAPFNATDIAQVNNRAGTTDQTDPRWVAEAKVQDPWPTTDLKNPDGTPKLKADGTPETVRQGSLESTKQHNATLMAQFADVQRRWREFSKQDTTTPQAADARLTFNGRMMGDMLTNPEGANEPDNRLKMSSARIRLPEGEREAAIADTPPRDPTRLVQSQEVTPEQLKRATMKAEQEAPILVLPGDESALARLGYDPATGTIPDLANEGIRGVVVPQARQFNTGAPGEGTPQPTIRVIMPGSSLETARYFGARLGQKLGTDEVLVTWPTGPDRGHPVLSIDSPSDAGWDAEALQKAPWAQRLMEHGSLSADGRTIFITDLRGGAGLGDTDRVQGPGGALGTDFVTRAQDILNRAGVPQAEANRYVRMSADFGSELIGGRDFDRIVARPPLSLSGDIGRTLAGRSGQRTMATPTGEELPGAMPGARNLREYAGPGLVSTENPRSPTEPGALGLPQPDLSATAGQAAGAYTPLAPEQAAYHNSPDNWGSSFNPTQGNLENEKVFMVGAFPMRMWTVEGTHEVTQQQFEDFAAANQDLLTRFPELSVGTWKDRTPDGAPRVTLDLSLAVDNQDEAMRLGHLLRQDAIHQMEGHHDHSMDKGQWGDILTSEEDVINAIQRVRTEGAFGAGTAGAGSTPGELPGAALGAGAAQRDGGQVGAAPDTGLAGDEGGSLGDGTVGTAGGAVGNAIRAGLRRAGARDTLDENLQLTQMVGGAAKGALYGAEYDDEQEEDNPLKRAARIAGGALLGATAGASSPNAVRLGRAINRASGGDALSRLSSIGRRLAGDETGSFGIASKGPGGEGTLPAPERGVSRGEEMGLGDLTDPENLTDLLTNPPKGLSGDQINEIGRAAFHRLRSGMTSEQTVQQREAERVRRLARRQEGLQRVEQAQDSQQVADAAADAEDAARRGEMPRNDADAIRGKAARKLAEQTGRDGPPEPGELDRKIAESRARRGLPKPEDVGTQKAKAEAQELAAQAESKGKGKPAGQPQSGVTTLPAGVRAVTDKTPIRFPEREITTAPGVEGQPAQVADRVVQPGEDESARRPLPGFEDLVPQIAELAKVANPETPPPWIEGTAAQMPETTLGQVTRAPEAGRVVAPGPDAARLRGVDAETGSTVEGPYVRDAALDRASGRPGGITPPEQERVADLPPQELLPVPGIRGTAAEQGVIDPRRALPGAPEPGEIRTPLEPGLRRQVLPGAAPGSVPLAPKDRDQQFVKGDVWEQMRARDRAMEAAQAQTAENRTKVVAPPAPSLTSEGRPPPEANPSLPNLIGPDSHRLVDEHGNLLSKRQIASGLMGAAATPGGWTGVLREISGWSPAMQRMVAGSRGVPLSPAEVDGALASVGGKKGKGTTQGASRWEEMSNKQREGYKDLRWSHVFDGLGTAMRMNLVVTPESIIRNGMSTMSAVPMALYEGAVAPVFQRAWAALPGMEDKSGEAMHARESLAMIEGMWRAGSAAAANAAQMVRHGDPDKRLGIAANQLDNPTVDFHQTKLAEYLGIAFRPLSATDAYLKTINEGMEAYRLAYRQASNEWSKGLLNPEAYSIRSRMMEILNTPSKKMLDQIQQAGEYNTYNQKAGRVANIMESIKNWDGGGNAAVSGAWRLFTNFAVPFVRISTNVMKYGLERTIPGGAISLAHGLATGADSAEMGKRTAKMTEGALFMGMLGALDANDVIDVAGGLPEDDTEREEWELSGKTPYSVRIGDRWYSFAAYPGIAENLVMYGALGDIRRKIEDKEARGEETGLGDWMNGILDGGMQYMGQTGVRPMFGSVVNLLGAMTARGEGQRQYYRDQLGKSAVGQIAPLSGAMRQVGNWTDTTQREAEGWKENLAAIYPWWRENLPAKTNALGEEMESETSNWLLAGATSSKQASDRTEPRKYRGSDSARMDLEISRAIDAVNAYEKDRRGNPRPTTEQRRMARRYAGRLNPRRKRLDEKVKKAEDRAAMYRLDGGVDPFAFQIPGRFRREEELVS